MESPSLNAKNRPGWIARRIRGLATTFFPEIFEQGQNVAMSRYGVVKAVGGKFGEFDGGSQFAIERPSAGTGIDAARALESNRGFVYAAMNALAREVMTIDWRLFEASGDDHEEMEEHAVLDLLDTVNDNMIGLTFKYLLSACLTLTGNCYVFLEGVKGDLDEPKALHLMPPDRVTPVIDRRSWPYQLLGYKMKLETREYLFQPYEVIHLSLPNPSDFFVGTSPVAAAAEFIDNDHYAMEFNRKFFRNGARPAGFLETEMVAETQVEALKIGFANMHQGIDNMQGIAVLPKGVKWAGNGANPKDMDFKNLSEDMRDRILAMFGVSRTILGTAESDTNRATAETADYVFSKRVVKPHMLLICAFLNEKLVPRYGDDIYLSFIDPVPEDRAARTTEMEKASGGVPIITQNEARDEFMGLGPVDGGDTLLKPNTMGPANAPTPEPDANAPADGNANGNGKKPPKAGVFKAANGQRVAFRPARTKLLKRAKQRSEMKGKFVTELTARLAELLEKGNVKKFESTPERDEQVWKTFGERVGAAQKEIAEAIKGVNAKQKEEVLANIPNATEKAVDPAKLFDIEKWISITIDAVKPTAESLFSATAQAAASEVGKPELNPFNDTAKAALRASIAKMADSYQRTVRGTLETIINDGLSSGQSLADMSNAIGDRYAELDGYAAERIAKTESFRTSNMALKTAWRESGVVKTVRWYTALEPCPFCQELDGKIVGVEDNFLDSGQTLTAGEGEAIRSMTADYGDVGEPPLHPNCQCFLRPEDVSIDDL